MDGARAAVAAQATVAVATAETAPQLQPSERKSSPAPCGGLAPCRPYANTSSAVGLTTEWHEPNNGADMDLLLELWDLLLELWELSPCGDCADQLLTLRVVHTCAAGDLEDTGVPSSSAMRQPLRSSEQTGPSHGKRVNARPASVQLKRARHQQSRRVKGGGLKATPRNQRREESKTNPHSNTKQAAKDVPLLS